MASQGQAASSSGAAADIFGSGVAGASKKKVIEQRIKLTNFDTVAAKALDPWGVSVLADAPLDKLWTIVKKGDKFAKFFSELAATDETGGDYRVGLGLSRFCEVMFAAATEIKDNEDVRACLNAKVLAHATLEAEALLPHLRRLNAGKSSLEGKQDTFGGLKRRKLTVAASGPTPTQAELEESAAKIYKWLEIGSDSNLRMLIQFMSNGGVFFAANAADKTARAWQKHAVPAVTVESMKRVVGARHAAAPEQSPRVVEKATGGLFD
jgi:hypothetical protein